VTTTDLSLSQKVSIGLERSSALEQRIAELFELLKDPLYRYLVGILGNKSEAEDLTQELLKLHCPFGTRKRSALEQPICELVLSAP